MGCDYGSILFIGVKLASVDALFDEVEKTEYGCQHKVDDNNKYCPECGRLARRKVKVKEAKIPLAEDWEYTHDDPVIDNKYYLFFDRDYGNEIYVGVYSELEWVTGGVMSLGTADTERHIAEKDALLDFLDEKNIKYEENSYGIHVIPYISC